MSSRLHVFRMSHMSSFLVGAGTRVASLCVESRLEFIRRLVDRQSVRRAVWIFFSA